MNNLSLVSRKISNGDHIPLLAADGKIIEGQCSLHFSEPNEWGVRTVTVIFEVKSDFPKECTMWVDK